jgi:hypothetical protein
MRRISTEPTKLDAEVSSFGAKLLQKVGQDEEPPE